MTMTAQKIHPFEAAGLGHAPFRCVGYRQSRFRAAPDAPSQPGSSCDFCGTGIVDVFLVMSSDGREFKVGSDCIRKVYSEFDGTVPPDFRLEIANLQREKRDERRVKEQIRIQKRVAAARDVLDAHPWLFGSKPHPNAYWAGQGKTLRDYLLFMLRCHSNQGREDACRIIEGANKDAPRA